MNDANRKSRLLKLREQQVVLAEMDVRQASQQLQAMVSRIDQQQARIDELSNDVRPGRLEDLLQLSQVLIVKRAELDELQGELATRRERLIQATERLVDAKTSAESLLHLHNQHVAKRIATISKREQLSIDEAVARSWTKSGQQDG